MNNSPKIKLYTTPKATETAIGKFHMAGQTLQTEAHVIACSVLSHYSKHKDKRIVEKMLLMFVQAMPEMSRINALKAWFEHHGPVTFGEKNSVLYVPGKATMLGDAMKLPFWKFAPEPDYKPMNVATALESLIKKLDKDAAETKRDHTAVITALKLIDPEHKPKVTKASTPKAIAKQKRLRTAKAAPTTAPAVEAVH